MSAPAGLDPASIPERIKSEVQRAIQGPRGFNQYKPNMLIRNQL